MLLTGLPEVIKSSQARFHCCTSNGFALLCVTWWLFIFQLRYPCLCLLYGWCSVTQKNWAGMGIWHGLFNVGQKKQGFKVVSHLSKWPSPGPDIANFKNLLNPLNLLTSAGWGWHWIILFTLFPSPSVSTTEPHDIKHGRQETEMKGSKTKYH